MAGDSDSDNMASQGTTLGSYLRAMREQTGRSLRQVEDEAGISNGYLSLLEHNKIKEPSPRYLFALARVYNDDYLNLMRMAGYPVPIANSRSKQPRVVFQGAEGLSDEDREEIQQLITWKLLRRKAGD